MNVGHAVCICRAAKHLTLEELSERSNLSKSYLSMIESGKRNPSMKTVKSISDALNIPLPVFIMLSADIKEMKGIDKDTIIQLRKSVLDAIGYET